MKIKALQEVNVRVGGEVKRLYKDRELEVDDRIAENEGLRERVLAYPDLLEITSEEATEKVEATEEVAKEKKTTKKK